MRYRELARRLRHLGCQELRSGKGSHHIWYNPSTGKVASVPDWGAKDLAPGTVRAILRELHQPSGFWPHPVIGRRSQVAGRRVTCGSG